MFIYGEESELKTTLGFWQLTLMGLSGALGAGFFVVISEAVAIGGALTPLAFFVAAFLAFLVSRIYAELATAMPIAGGGQVYIRNAFDPHPLFFLVHWLTWLAKLSFTALNALGLGFYLSLLVPLNPILISLSAVFVLVLINLRGIGSVGLIELITGAALLVSLLVLSVIVFLDPVSAISLPELSGGSLIAWIPVIPLISVIFIGSGNIATLAGEVKDKKDIKRAGTAIITGILLATVIFSLILFTLFTPEQLSMSSQPFALLGEVIGPLASTLGIIVAILGCISSMIFGSLVDTRSAFAMSKAGEFPDFFSHLSKHKVPYISIITSGVLVCFLVLSGSAVYVAYLASAGFLIEIIFVSLALMKLRRKRPHLPRPVLAQPYPLVPVTVIALSVILLMFIEPIAWLSVVVFAIIGFVIILANHLEWENTKTALLGIAAFLILTGVVTVITLLM